MKLLRGLLAVSLLLAVGSSTWLVPAGAGAATPALAVLPDGSLPWGVVTDASGNIYTSNSGTNSVSKITPDGTVTRFAGTGLAPRGIAIDASGNLYTANSGSNTVTKITPDGVATTAWAATGSSPWGITVAGDTIFVANKGSRSVTRITSLGATQPWGGQTGIDPQSIATDSLGRVYTANVSSGTITRIGASGTNTAALWASPGSSPSALAADSSANVYAASSGANSVTKYNASGSSSSFVWTASGPDLNQPSGLARDSAGNLYAPNYATNTVARISADGTTTSLFATLTLGAGPRGITIDNAGHLIVASETGNRVYSIPLTAPGTPPAPSAVGGDGQATVTVATGVGGTPASFTVTSNPGGKTCAVTGASGSCTVTALDNGTDYTFTATASNEAGTSSPSAPSNTVRPTAAAPDTPPAGPAPSLPPAPVLGGSPGLVGVTPGSPRITRTAVTITSRLAAPGPGRFSQALTTGNGTRSAARRQTTLCRASLVVPRAGSYTTDCRVGKAGRNLLRRSRLSVTMTTTFTPADGVKVVRINRFSLNRAR